MERLKGTVVRWIGEVLNGPYDMMYAVRRWKVGWRHVEIGLDQVYTNVALSRLRRGLLHALDQCWQGDVQTLLATRQALNTLIDLYLAKIEHAYQPDHASPHHTRSR